MDKLFTSKDDDNVILNLKVLECEDQFALLSANFNRQDAKVRFICITADNKKKVRIHKVKQDKPAVFNIGKSWGLDEVKSVETLKENGVCVNVNGKPYYWMMDSPSAKIELMFNLVSLSQKHFGKVPRLVGIDEEFLKDQMELFLAGKINTVPRPESTAVQPKTALNASGGMTGTSMNGSAGNPTATSPTPTQMYNNDLDAFLEKELDSKLKSEQENANTGFNMDELLGGFNWQVNGDAADLERKLESELQALEAANVHSIIESEEQAEYVIAQIDATLNELSTIDQWLLHYTTLLDRMGQDVHSVEVKNKVLQITSHNQKALLQEINKIVSGMKLSEPVSERLKYESLDELSGIKNCQHVLKVLMDTIAQVKVDEAVSRIAMVKERVGLYQSYATTFSVRLTEFVKNLIVSLADTLSKEKGRTAKLNLKISGLDAVQMKLCHYRTLMKWLKSIDTRKQYDLEMTYSHEFGKFYKRELREYLENLKTLHTKRKPTVEEQDYVFIVPQVSVSSAATNALTAMGSNMLEKGKGVGWNVLGRKKSTRPEGTTSMEVDTDEETSGKAATTGITRGGGTIKRGDRADDDKIWPDEAMIEVYKSLCPMIICEMNFVMDFFNLRKPEEGTVQDLEFSYEWLENLHNPREKLKELKAQNKFSELYDAIFDIHDDICAFLDWGLKHDQTYTVGIMVHIEECINKYANTVYTGFVYQMDLLMTKAVLNFERFVDEQIKGIEETKVTFRKRQGILPFIRTFPKFVDHMEKCVDGTSLPQGQARTVVSNAYSRIVKCIFDTLEAMAKDQNDGKGESKTDDKESLNVHILTIENMHHFHSEIRARKIAGLEQFVKASKVLYDVNVEAYIKIVIRKPLGKLLEFFENVENLLKSNAPEEVSFHLHKVSLRDVLKKYPGKEIKKGLEQLYKKVEKSFTATEEEAGTNSHSGSLLQVVWRGIQEACAKNLKRYEELIALCYSDTGLKVEFTMDDLLGYFSELAQNH
ncbi:exocyst complex component Sec3-domain-containing protein [Obelidium mucronatum]|nr:exocyst complex component Sec3-domain-containing protein [Obelidium mucronatum]